MAKQAFIDTTKAQSGIIYCLSRASVDEADRPILAKPNGYSAFALSMPGLQSKTRWYQDNL